MKFCYACFVESGRNSEKWDLIPCDITVKETCEKCGLIGIYVREVIN